MSMTLSFPIPLGSLTSMARVLLFRQRAGAILLGQNDPVFFQHRGCVDHLPVHQLGTVSPHYMSDASRGEWARLHVKTSIGSVEESLIVEKSLQYNNRFHFLAHVKRNQVVIFHQQCFEVNEHTIRDFF